MTAVLNHLKEIIKILRSAYRYAPNATTYTKDTQNIKILGKVVNFVNLGNCIAYADNMPILPMSTQTWSLESPDLIDWQPTIIFDERSAPTGAAPIKKLVVAKLERL